MSKLIGLGGKAGAGKDTVADMLVNDYGYIKVAFADKLREMLYALNPLVAVDADFETTYDRNGNFLYEEAEETYIYVQDVIDQYGWDSYKATEHGAEIRRLIQRLGTEAGQVSLGKDVWVNALFRGLDPKLNYVISDVRFPPEAVGVLKNNGTLWYVKREKLRDMNTNASHSSENSLSENDFDMTIENNSTLTHLKSVVDAAVNINL